MFFKPKQHTVFLAVLVLLLLIPMTPIPAQFEPMTNKELRTVNAQDGLTFQGDLDLAMDAFVLRDESGGPSGNLAGYLILNNISINDVGSEFTVDADGSNGLSLGVQDFDFVDVGVQEVCLDWLAWAQCFNESAFELEINDLDMSNSRFNINTSSDDLLTIDGQFRLEFDELLLHDHDGYDFKSGGAFRLYELSFDDGSGGAVTMYDPIEIQAQSQGLRINAPRLSSHTLEIDLIDVKTSSSPCSGSNCPRWEFHDLQPQGSWIELGGR